MPTFNGISMNQSLSARTLQALKAAGRTFATYSIEANLLRLRHFLYHPKICALNAAGSGAFNNLVTQRAF